MTTIPKEFAGSITDPLELYRRWSSSKVGYDLIEVAARGLNHTLLPPRVRSARRTIPAACELTRSSGRRAVLILDPLHVVLIEAGEVLGVLDLTNKLQPRDGSGQSIEDRG